MSRPTETPTHSDRIVREIETEIMSGARAPGSHLNEQEIADRFSVSRTPVREAVRQLSSAGLVDVLPRRGAFVARIPVTRLLQMFETLAELQGAAARLAAHRMRKDERRALQRIHAAGGQLLARTDAAPYFDSLENFHRAVFDGAHNDVLCELATRLLNQSAAYRRRQLANARAIKKAHASLGAVLDALLAGEEEQAEHLMRAHAGGVGADVMDLVGGLAEE